MTSDSSDSESKPDSPRPKRDSRSNSSASENVKQDQTTEDSFKRGPRTPSTPQSPKSPASDVSRSPSRSRSSPRSALEIDDAIGKGPRSPPENLDDDGRSNISSGSSLLSNKEDEHSDGEAAKSCSSPPKTHFQIPHAEDLSDVSDLDASDCLNDPEPEPERILEKEKEKKDYDKEKDDEKDKKKKAAYDLDDGEQLDFEAEDQPDNEKNDGEIDEKDAKGEGTTEDNRDEKEPGEEKEEDGESLEEGEVSDDEPKPEKPPVCRFYSRGACTWGSNCRFLHPGVTDKGNYSMFETTRPLVAPSNGLGGLYPHERPYPPPLMMPRAYPPPIRREDPVVESAWERGLRQAKEMMRKSTKRKETDMDFEEKKMNMTIGQDEIDKENDYYSRATSPSGEPELWARGSQKTEPERRPAVRVVERYEDLMAGAVSPVGYDRYDRLYRGGYDKLREHPDYVMRREKKYYEEDLSAPHSSHRSSGSKSKHSVGKMTREVIVQRVEKEKAAAAVAATAMNKPAPYERKADEWSDPWMRSKSPAGGKKGTGTRARRGGSYSSGSSSYSSSSRSSSNSSYSSYSRSRSRSGSAVSRSRSGSPIMVKRRAADPDLPRKRAPAEAVKETKIKPFVIKDKKLTTGSTLMNPPAPTPKKPKEPRISPSTAIRKVGLNPPAPVAQPPKPKTGKVAKASKGQKGLKRRSSRSSSESSTGSASSASTRSQSRSRSHSSYSSSSGSSVSPSRPARRRTSGTGAAAVKAPGVVKKGEVAGTAPVKGVQMGIAEAKKESLPTPVVSRKRSAEEAVAPVEANSSAKSAAAKKTSSRREELLKQLKAVEEAIARKRSKI